MTRTEIEKHRQWLEKWTDSAFVQEMARAAGVDYSDSDEVVRMFKTPLRLASMLSYPDHNSGLADMQVWFARIPLKMDLPLESDS